MQPREWKVNLAFKTCDREHLVAPPAGVAGNDVQKGCLADAGCSRDEQSTAVPCRLGKSIVELSQLSVAADQPGSAHPGQILPQAHI